MSEALLGFDTFILASLVNLKSDLSRNNAMDQFCGVLGNYGAESCGIFNCPEASHLHLIKSDQINEFLSAILRRCK
jgi:hypothetical protein